MEALEVRPGVEIPAQAMTMHAARSGGPGGQNVNKVSSKVELRVELWQIVGLDAGSRARLFTLTRGKLDADGKLLVVSQRTRDQRQNLEDAREKVRELVLEALKRPVPRRPTKPTRGSVERRIAEKRNRAQKKVSRQGRGDD